MSQDEVHAGGIFGAVGLAAVASAGAILTTFRGELRWDAIWISTFAVSVLLLSAALVNFDMKRWLW